MKYTFAMAGQDETIDSLVESFGVLVDQAKKKDFVENEEYKKNNKLFSESLIKYCLESNGIEYTGLEMLKNPMVTNRGSFKETFDTVLAQIITPIMPKLTSEKYATLYDVKQVGFGDNALYTVDSDQLFIVNETAEGIARGGIQTLYNNEYTVRASKKSISVGVDWYHVASGVQDWGRWGIKIVKSFEAYISAAVVKALTSVIKSADSLKAHGISGYVANGISDANWMNLKTLVSLANGGAPVYALGTDVGLSEILPDATNGFRFSSDDPYVSIGYLPVYKNVPLFEIDNAIIPNTINGTPKTLVDDDIIYMLAAGSHRPVKVVFEGNTVTVAEDALNRRDHTYSLTIDMRIGVDVIVGSKFGAIIK